MEKAKQAFEGMVPYEVGYQKGYRKGQEDCLNYIINVISNINVLTIGKDNSEERREK